MAKHSAEPRFAFGQNWLSFLETVDDRRIEESRAQYDRMLGSGQIKGKTFLDVGSGSGLSSLTALLEGASRVVSFDYDPKSVACTQEMKARYAPNEDRWQIQQGSVLDDRFLETLGEFDIVYSWGVLHHTGDMWRGFESVASLVAPGGRLYIAIYNDQGRASTIWRRIKRLYVSGPAGRLIVLGSFFPVFATRALLSDVLSLRNPASRYRDYYKSRGMSLTHDWVDWLGGYPFEVATPEAVIHFFVEKGFALKRLKTVAGKLGCNEYVFAR